MQRLPPPSRAGGIIMHPTSFPSRYGIGDLGPAAHRWVDWIAATGTRLWQILPLGPTGYGDSPYQCFSSFAGNPYLVSPELLADDGLVTAADLSTAPDFPVARVDFGAVIPWKLGLLDRAWERLGSRPDLEQRFAAFREEEAEWLDDFTLFMALKDRYDGRPWTEWPRPLRLRDPDAIDKARAEEAGAIERHAFRQWLFFEQWDRLKAAAVDRGVVVIGDLPIFVAADSADVWSRRELFDLDEEGRPRTVAGVPPDYFSATGQLWGNPQYRWERHAAEGYRWWISRIEATLRLVDIIRIDHFRAFADYWEIPADAPTAQTGRWRDGPGLEFFTAVREALGDLPLIAEDLGELSPKVPALLRATGLPGMRVLQLAFGDDERNDFLPHRYPIDCVAYTGTHDNDTVLGFWATAPDHDRRFASEYLRLDPADIAGGFIAGVWQSRAKFGLTTTQDLLRLGSEARMNRPGEPAGNWQWRMRPDAALDTVGAELAELNDRYDR